MSKRKFKTGPLKVDYVNPIGWSEEYKSDVVAGSATVANVLRPLGPQEKSLADEAESICEIFIQAYRDRDLNLEGPQGIAEMLVAVREKRGESFEPAFQRLSANAIRVAATIKTGKGRRGGGARKRDIGSAKTGGARMNAQLRLVYQKLKETKPNLFTRGKLQKPILQIIADAFDAFGIPQFATVEKVRTALRKPELLPRQRKSGAKHPRPSIS
jgi:hypothetical protein